ncbi:hypothetical protein [Bifidobacterium platyrrhinorum]|uniref:Tape measure protein n=1 Tax=Bifidobacterium platyrrhinorum TaxID=2661628 RepID=A0A6L9SV94_9BIFI|nr:hypothetical protein [Bifidobacterium platyrrhinorum]NEG55472.1 hypothetical protein [Bifidobacterium platyrrhinorum]
MALYSAGEVGVDVVPDTSGFWAILNAELHSRHPEVHVDVDTRDVGKAQAQLNHLDGQTLTSTIKVDGDYSGLHKYVQQMDAAEKQMRRFQQQSQSAAKFDARPFLVGLKSMQDGWGAANKRMRDEWAKTHDSLDIKAPSNRVEAQLEAIGYKYAALGEKNTAYQKTLDDLTSKQSELWAKTRADMERFAAEQKKLTDEQVANEKRLAEAVTRTNKQRGAWASQATQAQKRLAEAEKELAAAQAKGDKDAAKAAEERIATEKARLRQYEKSTDAAVKSLQKVQRETQKTSAAIDKSLAKIQKSMDSTAKNAEKALKPLNAGVEKAVSGNLDLFRKAGAEFVKEIHATAEQTRMAFDHSGPLTFLHNLQSASNDAAKELKQLRESESETARTQSMLAEAFDDTTNAMRGNAKARTAMGKAFSKSSLRDNAAQTAELTKRLDEQNGELDSLIDHFKKAKKYGLGLSDEFGDMGKRINAARDHIAGLRKLAEQSPIRAKFSLDTLGWDKTYAKVLYDAKSLARELDREYELKIRIDSWKDDAERLEKRLDQLKHQRLDVPVDFEMDEKRIIERMREVAAEIKANPERAVELEANLELDMKRAEEKLKKFREKNDELKMDLDLETALARAHLAYFTRPRTVDIFANFKGTDMGKILAGMFSGSTGLKGVENQFQRLVNLMDSLDTKVPKFALWGSALMAVGAGATNLAGSIGGVGKSLVSLSKAAYAAPAALGTVAAGFYGIYAAAQVAGDRFKLANTALKDLQSTVGNAFWDEATDAITRMSNTLGGDFVRNLAEVSAEEGRMAAGMADIITRANEAGRINAMLDHATDAVRNLRPGVEAVVDSFTSLGRVGGQYVPQLTNWISQNLTHFAMWAAEVESDNARVESAMQGVKEQAGYLGSSIGSLKGIFSGVFGTLAQYENGIQGFSEALEAADKAVNSVRFQDSLTAWIDGAQRAQSIVRNSFSSIGEDAYSLRNEVYNAFVGAGRVVGSTMENISQLLASSGAGIRDFTDGIASGWSRAMDAIGDSGPVFSELLSMVGSLADTFGGTFAASLKAASPMLRVIASATSSISEAFNSLPEPVKAAAGLWVTFGRAGKTAITSLKTGMLQNIQQTLQYKSTMQQLGVTTKQTAIGFRELVAAMDSLRRGQVSGALSGSITGVRQLGDSAEEATAKVEGVAAAGREVESSTTVITSSSRKAASGLSEAGEAASKNAGRLSAVGGAFKSAGSLAKSAGGLIVDAFGGPAGLAVTAGMALVTTAISDYSLKAQSAETASQNVADAMKNIATSAQDTASSLGVVGKAIKENLEDPNFGEDGLQGWMASHTGGALYGQFKDAASAASKLGLSLDDMAKSVAGGKNQYAALTKKLQQYRKEALKNRDETGKSIKIDKEKMDAVNKVADAAKKANDQALEEAKTTAKNNGYTEAYVQKLYDMGEGYDQIAAKTQSATQKAENYATSLKLAAQNQQNHSNALIAARSAGSLYQKTLDGMGDTIKQVNALAAQGQQVWDDQANDFNLTTEAGRLASDALGTLATNAKSYVNAMIESGDSLDDVNAKNDKMRESFYNTALQMTGNADAAKALTDQYMMTPSEVETTFKAHFENAKLELLQYLALIRDTFPDGKGDAIYNAIVNAITSGAVTDITGLQQLVQKYTTGNYQAVVTADGTQALLQMSTINQLGIEFDGENYKTTLSAEDLASPRIDEVVAALSASGLDGKTIQMILQAQGDAKLTIDQTQDSLTKLGASADDINIIINGQDHSKAEVDAAIENVSKLTGLSKDTIRFMIEATDGASKPMEDIQRKKVPLAKGASFDITANDDEASVTLASYKEKDGQTIAESKVAITGDDQVTPVADSAKQAIWLIPTQWGTLLAASGDTADVANAANTAVVAIPQEWLSSMFGYDGTSAPAKNADGSVRNIPPQWDSQLRGLDNTSAPAKNAATAVKSVPESRESRIAAKVSGLDAVKSLSSAIGGLASKTISIVTNFITHGSPSSGHLATGGRILGPGTATSDSIPAWLSNGEMVLRASSVRKLDAKYGRSFLNALNAYGDVDRALRPSAFALNARRRNQAYATGGRVKAGDMSWNIELNPVVKVELPDDSKGTQITNNVSIDGVRASDRQIVDAVQTVIQVAGRTRNMRVR